MTRRGAVVAGCAAAVAVALAVELVVEGGEDEPPARELPAADQKRLPIKASLGNLCPGASTPQRFERRLRRQADRLLVELERRPDWLVDYTYYTEQHPPQRTTITVRELGEEALHDLEVFADAGGPRECEPELQQQLRAALG